MTYLHNNKQLFSDILDATQNATGISRAIIEKDYFLDDYIEVTTKLLFETVSYQTVKNNLLEIIPKME